MITVSAYIYVQHQALARVHEEHYSTEVKISSENVTECSSATEEEAHFPVVLGVQPSAGPAGSETGERIALCRCSTQSKTCPQPCPPLGWGSGWAGPGAETT